MRELFKAIVLWELKAFPYATTRTRVEHLKREVYEVLGCVKDFEERSTTHIGVTQAYRENLASELADVLMLCATIAAGEGIPLEDAVRRKFAVVQSRSYASPDAQGVREHLR